MVFWKNLVQKQQVSLMLVNVAVEGRMLGGIGNHRMQKSKWKWVYQGLSLETEWLFCQDDYSKRAVSDREKSQIEGGLLGDSEHCSNIDK